MCVVMFDWVPLPVTSCSTPSTRWWCQSTEANGSPLSVTHCLPSSHHFLAAFEVIVLASECTDLYPILGVVVGVKFLRFVSIYISGCFGSVSWIGSTSRDGRAAAHAKAANACRALCRAETAGLPPHRQPEAAASPPRWPRPKLRSKRLRMPRTVPVLAFTRWSPSATCSRNLAAQARPKPSAHHAVVQWSDRRIRGWRSSARHSMAPLARGRQNPQSQGTGRTWIYTSRCCSTATIGAQ